ncbi:MAG: leucine-rich repeat domain-containing protein, partial [Treponema sp.]|nr:leucine-rich repeat domain-containing protein [Treponema sp.]
MKTKYVLCAGLPLVLAAFLLSSCAGLSRLWGGSPAKTFGGFSYKIVGSAGAQTVTITGYTGAGGAAEIPAVIEEHPVTAVEKDAFDKLTTLTSLTIPASVALIAESVDKAEDAFDGATGLTSITVDEANSVYSSADGVLFNKAKTRLFLYPEGKSGGYVIPSSVTDIVYCAFEDCAKLTDITIPDSVTSIG